MADIMFAGIGGQGVLTAGKIRRSEVRIRITWMSFAV